jgi:hypothetical protein
MVFCANCVWKVSSFLFLNCAASFFDLRIWGDLEQRLEGFPRLLWLWPRCSQSHWSRYCEKREVADLLTRVSFGGCKQKINERKGTSIKYLCFRRGVAPTWPHPSKFQRCVVLATFFFLWVCSHMEFFLPQGFRRYSSIFWAEFLSLHRLAIVGNIEIVGGVFYKEKKSKLRGPSFGSVVLLCWKIGAANAGPTPLCERAFVSKSCFAQRIFCVKTFVCKNVCVLCV